MVWPCYEGSLINLSLSYNILLQAAAIKLSCCSLSNRMAIISLLQVLQVHITALCTALPLLTENSNESFIALINHTIAMFVNFFE